MADTGGFLQTRESLQQGHWRGTVVIRYSRKSLRALRAFCKWESLVQQGHGGAGMRTALRLRRKSLSHLLPGLVLLLGVDTGTVLVESTSGIVTFESFPCQAKCDIFVVDFTPHGGDSMGESKQITEVLSNAWQQGIEIGQDINQSRAEQRMIVAQRVKALRSAKGISQEKMSNIIHANTLTYRGYENCKSDIPLFYLVRIADALETSLDYLAGRTEIREQSSLEQRVQKLETIVLKGTDS